MRLLDSFHLNAFAQIEMSAYGLVRLQIAEFVFSSRTKELQVHLLPLEYLICANWWKTTTFTQTHYTTKSLLAFMNTGGYANRLRSSNRNGNLGDNGIFLFSSMTVVIYSMSATISMFIIFTTSSCDLTAFTGFEQIFYYEFVVGSYLNHLIVFNINGILQLLWLGYILWMPLKVWYKWMHHRHLQMQTLYKHMFILNPWQKQTKMHFT